MVGAESSQSVRFAAVNYHVAKAKRPACNAADNWERCKIPRLFSCHNFKHFSDLSVSPDFQYSNHFNSSCFCLHILKHLKALRSYFYWFYVFSHTENCVFYIMFPTCVGTSTLYHMATHFQQIFQAELNIISEHFSVLNLLSTNDI